MLLQISRSIKSVMFESNEDFDLDEEFLNVITSTQKVQANSKLSVSSNETISNTSVSVDKTQCKSNIFSSNFDDFDDDFLSDTIAATSKPISSKSFVDKIDKPNNKSPTKIIDLLSSKRTSSTSVFKRLNDENVNDINHENKKVCRLTEIVSPAPNHQINSTIVRKRKFPGPAGLLPEITGIADVKGIVLPENTGEIKSETEINFCSQDTKALFSNGPWQKMSNDFKEKFDTLTLPEKFTISWLKEHANSKKLIQQKTPFLAAIVDHLTPDFTIRLKDGTGEINGGIDSEICDEFNQILLPGTVMVLKQVGVLTFSLRGHCLSITKNNLVAIYTLNSQVVKGPSYMSNTDLIKSIKDMETNYSKEISCLQNKTRVPLSTNLGYLNSKTYNPSVARTPLNYASKTFKTSSNKSSFSNKPAIMDSNRDGNMDINKILSSTFAGIDTDSLFDDF